jgi:tetratricopeptide (TPR) repeat protein
MSSKRKICAVVLLALLPLAFSNCKKKANPKEALVHIGKGIAMHQKKDYQGAIQAYNKAIEAYPQSAASYYYRGFAKFELKDTPGAVKDYTEAINLNPTYAAAYLNRGLARYLLGAQKAACLDFRKASEFGDERADKIIKKFCR